MTATSQTIDWTKVFRDKDPSLKSLLLQSDLSDRGFYTGALDNWWGPRSEDAYDAFLASANGVAQPQVPSSSTQLANYFRDTNADGVALIKHFEGLYLTAYQDEVGIWTIGWGHTGLKHNDGTVYKGRKITQDEAEQLLRYDLDNFEGRVSKFITVPLNDNEFAALVSFDFNTGGLGDSTLRTLLNKGDRAGAAEQFGRWVYAGGKKLNGLVRRRASEKNLFLSKQPYIVQA